MMNLLKNILVYFDIIKSDKEKKEIVKLLTLVGIDRAIESIVNGEDYLTCLTVYEKIHQEYISYCRNVGFGIFKGHTSVHETTDFYRLQYQYFMSPHNNMMNTNSWWNGDNTDENKEYRLTALGFFRAMVESDEFVVELK